MIPVSTQRHARRPAAAGTSSPARNPFTDSGREWLLWVSAFLMLCCQTRAGSGPALAQSTAAHFGARELAFEPETDQGNGTFLARGRNYQFLLTPTTLRFALFKAGAASKSPALGRHQKLSADALTAVTAGFEFLNANPQAPMRGEGELRGKINYFIGNEASRWRTGVPTFARVKVEELYPGIQLVYYGNQQQLEYDFTIAPRADPHRIALRVVDADQVTVNDQGELVIDLKGSQIHQPPPVMYQIKAGARVPVPGRYRLSANQTVGFEPGVYDPELPLIIDPRLEYSTYFGGNGGDMGLEIKVDGTGNVYFTGETLSTQFPFPVGTNVLQRVYGGGSFNGDAFVAKLDSTGTNLVYVTYLGGLADDAGYDLAIDKAGNAYITGFTESPNFPMRNALFPAISGVADPTVGLYPPDGFVAELNTNGSALVFSSYLGGSGFDTADGIAVDPAGNIYVTGFTASDDFPIFNAGQTNIASGFYDAFVTKLAPRGASLVFSTYLGGLSIDEGQGIAVDSKGFAYVTGFTASDDFPITTNAVQPFLNLTNGTAYYDAFLAKFTPVGGLVFSTYLGGTFSDFGYRVTVDGGGNAYVTGPSESLDFPITVTNVPGLVPKTSLYAGYPANYDAFLTKFTPNGQLVYSTLFGGTNEDVGWDVAVDSQGNAFVVGTTLSPDFPATHIFDPLRATNSGGHDVFVTAINSNATAVFYSGYLGGIADDFGRGIAVDGESSAYIIGNTASTNFPTAAPRLQSALDGPSDAFLAKIRLQDPFLTTIIAFDQLQLRWPATAPGYVLQFTLDLNPPAQWAPVGVPPVLSEGWYLVTLGLTNTDAFFRLQSP